MAATRPVVLVYQEYATLSSTPATPELNVLIAGPAYYIQDFADDKSKLLLATHYGTFDAAATGTSVAPVVGVEALSVDEPPSNLNGAILDADSVKVYFGDARAEITHAADVVTDADSPEVTSTLVDFEAAGVKPGDKVILTSAVPKTVVHTVRSVAGTTITCLDEIDAVGYTKVRVERALADFQVSGSFVSVSGSQVKVNGGVTADGKPVSAARVYVAYRALRTDLQEVKYLNDFNALKGLFGRTLDDGSYHTGVDARNPLAVGAAIAMLNTNTPVQIFGVVSDDLAGYLSLKGAISSRKDVYAVVPLTTDKSIIETFAKEFEGLADPDYAVTNGVPQKFRVVIGSAGELPTFGLVIDIDKNEDGGGQVVAQTGELATVHTLVFTNGVADAPNLSTLGVLPGDSLTLGAAEYTVTRVNAAGELEVAENLVAAAEATATDVVITSANGTELYNDNCLVETKVDAALHLEFYDANGTFVDDGVTAAHYLELPLDPTATTFAASTKWQVASVVSNQRLRVEDNGRDTALIANELPHGFARVQGGNGALIAVPATATLAYRIVKPLDKDGQVTELISVAQSFRNRRCVLCWPDKVDISGLTDGSLPRASTGAPAAAGSQPGYYLACAVGGMTAGLPSHQGFTKLGIAGIDKIYNANTYFDDKQLTAISNNGWLVFQQDTPSALPYVVHQLTTDPSTLQFGEFSMVKNFDFVSMFFSDILDDYIGIWNINKETMGYIEAALRAGIENLKLKRRVRIGAPIIDARIVQLGESTVSEDRLECYVEVDFPKPLNTVGLHIVSV